MAPGISLDTLATTNPDKYLYHSRLTGLELLSGLIEKGVFHADLHDGNEFVDEETKTKTYIDAGAVGDGREELKTVRRLFKGILFANSEMVAESILKLSDTEDSEIDTNLKNDLALKLAEIFKENLSFGEKVSHISFEIIDVAIPKPTLRYVLKALITGSHHLERLAGFFKGSQKLNFSDRLRAVRDLGKIGLLIITA